MLLMDDIKLYMKRRKDRVKPGGATVFSLRFSYLFRDLDEMEEEMYTVIGAEGVDSSNAAVRTQKCLQLANGALYTDEYGNW